MTGASGLAPEEDRFAHEVRRNLRRNYLAHLAHGLLGQTGMRLINAPTFVPLYVFALSGSELAVGAARGLQYLGMFLSPIVGATVIEHRRRVLPVAFLAGGFGGAAEGRSTSSVPGTPRSVASVASSRRGGGGRKN